MPAEPKKAEKGIYTVAILAWLLPGAGHWYLGMRSRGGIMFVGVCSTFVLGVLLGGIEIVDPENSHAWFCAEILTGAPALITTLLQEPQTKAGLGRGADLGEVYAGIAGLLNLMCVLDALKRAYLASRQDKPPKGK